MIQPKIYFLLIFSLLLTSCIPNKDLIYLQNKNNTSNQVVEPVIHKPYRLQTNDILIVNIRAIDPKLVDIFNANVNQGGTTGVVSSNYFNGYSVDYQRN